MSTRALRQVSGGLLVAASWLTVAACQGTQAAVPAAPPAPAPEVSVVTVVPERVALTSEWIATLDGYVNAQIHPQVSGYLVKRNYREGAAVHQGDVLFEIDPRPLNAVLSQANAQVAQAQAQLAKSARDVERDTPLAEQRAIAQSQLDTEIQAYRAAQANVQSLEAAVETAELNVEFTKVTSLIDGIAAIATAQIGDLVGPSTLLTTVSQVSPIKAYFAVSELDYLQMAGRINVGDKAPWAGRAALALILADGSVYPRTGSFLAADREIEATTGTIRISATFPNPERTLRPGQYGRVRAETHVRTDALLVPQRAVTELQGSFQLRVVGPDNKVSTKMVKVGDRIGGRWIVEEGLLPGTRVVVEGARTSDGMVVNPKPFTASTEGH
ncbi:MAG TPA: efflux RND transporter periplasmic adaptor subunit [Vicinamibacterales bacterium]|nr:efflux RND transporter periplasmic adaptor subunit [Vicinamibacterales bacterium]